MNYVIMAEYNVVDLFAGVGGLRLGFEEQGFKTVFSNDFDKTCEETYGLNFNSHKLDTRSIWEVDLNDFPNFNVLLGGFPCQACSIAGYREGFKDTKGRGNLFFKIAEILDNKKPEAFMLENVKNLKGHDKGKTFRIIRKILEYDLGYYIHSEVLNSMD